MKLRALLISLTLLLSAACHRPLEKANAKATWIAVAFASLHSQLYPKVKAIAWWHEDFDNSRLTINSSEAALHAYRSGVADSFFVTTPKWAGLKLMPPDTGVYHSAFPDFGGTEDVVTADKITAFESLVGKAIVWAYFSDNWYDSLTFPADAVQAIRAAGRVPFIRMMPRTNFDEGAPDPNYTLARIIAGDFDTALTSWATKAASLPFPILVEFGTEVNGDWFPWSGVYNGAGLAAGYGSPALPDGPERFRDAYRHIVDNCRAAGADNLTWFFHVNADSAPDADWNSIKNYYPGDDYVDWIGVSVYGAQTPDEDNRLFTEIMDAVYPQLTALGDKPIAILEFAVTELD